jgi:CDP-diacylglycerol--glycerol-3-phosphate 3-phosphatidyltransferase
MLAGWIVGLSAICDLLDGHVARRSRRTSVFGAFYDSTLDRIADGAVLGGLALFFARNGVHHKIPDALSTPMVSVILLGIIASFLTSYTRARAEGLGIDAKVGILQRPERVFLLSAPQAFFGLALGGWVLMTICVVLTVTAWITAVQRVLFVYRATAEESPTPVGNVKPTNTAEREAYSTRPGWLGDVARFGDRMLRNRENAAQLADVGPTGDATARRTEAGHSTTFDRAR